MHCKRLFMYFLLVTVFTACSLPSNQAVSVHETPFADTTPPPGTSFEKGQTTLAGNTPTARNKTPTPIAEKKALLTPQGPEVHLVPFDAAHWQKVGDEFQLDCQVVSMAASLDTSIWLGCKKQKIIKITGDQYTHYPIPKDLLTDKCFITVLSIGSDGAVWVGTTDEGILQFDGKTWRHYTAADGVPNDYVGAIEVAPNGIVWVGTSQNLLSFDGTTWTRYDQTTSPLLQNPIPVSAIAVTPDGKVWFGARYGLIVFDGKTWRKWRVAPLEGESRGVSGVEASPDGSLWLGRGLYTGLVHLFPEKNVWEVLTVPYLDHQGIGAVRVTENGAIWVGPNSFESQTNKAFYWDGQAWTVLEDMPYDSRIYAGYSVDDIAFLANGSILFSNSAGVYRYDP